MGFALAGVLVVAAIVGWALYSRRASVHTVVEAGGSTVAAVHGELGQFVAVLNTVNSEADPGYLSALARMRANVPGVMAEANRLVSAVSPAEFAARHSVVLAVAALQHAAAVDFLSQVALNPQPLPPKAIADAAIPDRELETEAAVQGTIVALDAIDGLERLADAGHAGAIAALVSATALDSLAIRGAALTALAARGDRRDQHARAVAALPAHLRHLASLQRREVREVPQVADPRVHLAGGASGTAPPPRLDATATHHGPAAPGTGHGAPQIRRS